MRRLGVLLLTAASAVACHRGGRAPGASFVGASLLEPLSEAEAAHDELLRADIARADSVMRRGMPEGLAAAFTDDVVYLRGGLPILRGRDAARAIAAAESLSTPFAVRWQPVRAEASRDGQSAGHDEASVADPGHHPGLPPAPRGPAHGGERHHDAGLGQGTTRR